LFLLYIRFFSGISYLYGVVENVPLKSVVIPLGFNLVSHLCWVLLRSPKRQREKDIERERERESEIERVRTERVKVEVVRERDRRAKSRTAGDWSG